MTGQGRDAPAPKFCVYCGGAISGAVAHFCCFCGKRLVGGAAETCAKENAPAPRRQPQPQPQQSQPVQPWQQPQQPPLAQHKVAPPVRSVIPAPISVDDAKDWHRLCGQLDTMQQALSEVSNAMAASPFPAGEPNTPDLLQQMLRSLTEAGQLATGMHTPTYQFAPNPLKSDKVDSGQVQRVKQLLNTIEGFLSELQQVDGILVDQIRRGDELGPSLQQMSLPVALVDGCSSWRPQQKSAPAPWAPGLSLPAEDNRLQNGCQEQEAVKVSPPTPPDMYNRRSEMVSDDSGFMRLEELTAKASPSPTAEEVELTPSKESIISFQAVSSEFSFIDTDNDRNRLVMLQGVLVWSVRDFNIVPAGWRRMDYGPCQFSRKSRRLSCRTVEAILKPNDVSRLYSTMQNWEELHTSNMMPQRSPADIQDQLLLDPQELVSQDLVAKLASQDLIAKHREQVDRMVGQQAKATRAKETTNRKEIASSEFVSGLGQTWAANHYEADMPRQVKLEDDLLQRVPQNPYFEDSMYCDSRLQSMPLPKFSRVGLLTSSPPLSDSAIGAI